jgi:hypothetical protein
MPIKLGMTAVCLRDICGNGNRAMLIGNEAIYVRIGLGLYLTIFHASVCPLVHLTSLKQTDGFSQNSG